MKTLSICSCCKRMVSPREERTVEIHIYADINKDNRMLMERVRVCMDCADECARALRGEKQDNGK